MAKCILCRGGYEIQKECDKYIMENGNLPEGSCCMTEAGRLDCKSIIHVVGPKGRLDNRNEAIL